MENKINFRLPTRKEFDNLIEYFSRWNKKSKGLEIENNKGDILFLPACGYYYDTSSYNVGSSGLYWSSTVDESDSDNAYYLYLDSNYRGVGYYHLNEKYAIRLVSDEPFEDGVLFDNIWWKPINEEGYYTWQEAMNKFNK